MKTKHQIQGQRSVGLASAKSDRSGKRFALRAMPMACMLAVSWCQVNHTVWAQSPGESADDWSVHGQFTTVLQKHGTFRSPYVGPNSMPSVERGQTTVDATLYIGRRLWEGAELYLNPEIDQGFGVGNTLGMAGFASGEAYKLGSNKPYYKTHRAFLRQNFEWGEFTSKTEEGANAFAARRTDKSLTLTAGKFSIVDIFDVNPYAHDPKTDFLNWSIIDAGAFDYGGDAWGYTYGAAAEWTTGPWTLRGGLFGLSNVPGGTKPDASLKQRAVIAELERRYEWAGQDGQIKLLMFQNRGDMGSYRDATALASLVGGPPATGSVRQTATKQGFGINWAQAIDEHKGVFARYSWNDGKTETFDFSDINQALSFGLNTDGHSWGRSGDRLGAAVAINRLSAPAREYFAAGGQGLLIGDGQLGNYGSERILEVFYSARINSLLKVSADYQFVQNPAYNRDRGPISIFGIRVHLEF